MGIVHRSSEKQVRSVLHPSAKKKLWLSNQVFQSGTHKIFLWNSDGVYVDCAFPNPIYGHFKGGMTILGARVHDVLHAKAAQKVLQGIQETIRSGRPRKIVVELRRDAETYHSEIQFIPLQQFVLGLVTDRPFHQAWKHKRQSVALSYVWPISNWLTPQIFTKREWEVLQAYRFERTNRQIGELLGITERAVKFHFKNILLKLQIPSRRHLASLGFMNSLKD